MSALSEGLAVLQIATDKGNAPAKAILDELGLLKAKIKALHDINSELNTQLREARQEISLTKWLAKPLTEAVLDTFSDNDADPMEHLTHVND